MQILEVTHSVKPSTTHTRGQKSKKLWEKIYTHSFLFKKNTQVHTHVHTQKSKQNHFKAYQTKEEAKGYGAQIHP